LRARGAFDPLDSSGSVARGGWRYNDKQTEVLYVAAVQSLALLEVVLRPEMESVDQVTIATIEVRDGSVVDLESLQITLPTNWNARPVARDSQSIAGQFLSAVQSERSSDICGVRVPSVIATEDSNVLLDPSRKSRKLAT
jgi:RES domain-containing protein